MPLCLSVSLPLSPSLSVRGRLCNFGAGGGTCCDMQPAKAGGHARGLSVAVVTPAVKVPCIGDAAGMLPSGRESDLRCIACVGDCCIQCIFLRVFMINSKEIPLLLVAADHHIALRNISPSIEVSEYFVCLQYSAIFINVNKCLSPRYGQYQHSGSQSNLSAQV